MLRLAFFSVLVLCPQLVAAQPGSDAKIAANALFDEGKRLIAGGKIDQACPKFEASLKLLDQLGVRLNLADCYEQQGKTATAWTEFREAASRADKLGDARATYARERAGALSSRLVKMKIIVASEGATPGLTVRRDSSSIPAEAFGSPLPVNPGRYTIEASASGYRTWSTSVEARRPGEVITVEIPALDEAPAGSEPGSANGPQVGSSGSVDRSAQRRHRQRLGLGIGAGGAVAFGVGVGLGFVAKSKWDSAGEHCIEGDICDAEGAKINRRARLYGNIGTVVGGVGVAAMVTGTVLYLTAPKARQVAEHAYLETHGGSGVSAGFSARF